MKLMKPVAALLGAALMMFAAVSAEAVCIKYGKVQRIYINLAGADIYAYIYLTEPTRGIPSFGWYYLIEERQMDTLPVIAQAAASGQTVRVKGDKASCPSIGTPWRYGGVIETVNVYNFQ